MEDIYVRLARHLENLVMGYPFSEALVALLKGMFTPEEALVALAIPCNLAPLEVAPTSEIVARTDLSEDTATRLLESLGARGRLYAARTRTGEKGYALLQVGYGMPQTFFWAGKEDETAKRMAKLVLDYFTVPTTQKVYGAVPTKSYRYSPAGLSVKVPMQGVMPNEQMEPILEAATKIALAHCPCRMSARILGRTDCTHSLEVCLKYDEMAEFVISKGLAREITRDEAHHLLEECEKEGLVHMVDNTQGQVKHTCNCCGDYCWNVGIIRRRRVPRDQLMAVYFIRETDLENCIGCGACADICPVAAVEMKDGSPVLDLDWCIGCGVCAVSCPAGVISIKRRVDKVAPETFSHLHRQIRQEKGLPGPA